MKKLNDLTIEEFTELLKGNKKLFAEAVEYAEETAYFWADDYLKNAPKNIYYKFAPYVKEFNISVFDYELYHYILKLQKDYEIFSDVDELLKKIEKAIALYDKYDNQYYYGINDKNAERIEKRLDELTEEIEEEIKTAIYANTYEFTESDDDGVIQLAYEMEIFADYETDGNGKAYKTITIVYE